MQKKSFLLAPAVIFSGQLLTAQNFITQWNLATAGSGATVTNMAFMFYQASAFNQNIGNWNTAAVADMYNMFNGAGFGSGISNYSFTHRSPAAGKNHYRIKQVDKDGRFTYSGIVTLINNKEQNNIILSPNPAQHLIQLNINISSPATIRIYSTEGKLMLQQQIPTGNQQRSIDISRLPSGMYSVLLQAGETIKTFIKH